MTREQLMFLHDLLDGHRDEEWIISANIILAASGIAEQVSEMEPAEKIVRGFLQRLLDEEDYLSAATLLWGNSVFDVRPKYVADVFDAIRDNALLLIQGASSTSKTYSAGAWMYLDWRRDPAYTAIKVAALNDDHLRKNLFSHIHTLHSLCSIPYEDPDDIKDIDLYFGLKSAGNQFGFSGIAFKQSTEASGHFKGYKPMPYRKVAHPKFGFSSRIRILGDEGQNWPEGPFKDFASPMSSIDGVEHVKIVITYNPESVAQPVVKLAEPEQGWLMDDMETLYKWMSKEGWQVLRLDAKHSENVVQRKVIYPNFQTYEGFMKLLKGEGDVSNRYYTFARGWPPLRSMVWTIVPASWPATQRGEAIFDEVICNCVSVDCAYQGMDKALMTVGRFGLASGWTRPNAAPVKFVDPNDPRQFKSRFVLQLDQQLPLMKSSSPTQLAQEIKGKCVLMGIAPEWVVVDGTGMGAGTASWLKEYWGDILIVDWGKGATEMKILAEDKNTAKERYPDIISEMHFAFKEWLNPDICAILIHPQISSNPINTQMSTRRFTYVKGGKMKVESKPEFKARNRTSPDEHDCAIMLVQIIRARANALPGMGRQLDLRAPVDEEVAVVRGDSAASDQPLELGSEGPGGELE